MIATSIWRSGSAAAVGRVYAPNICSTLRSIRPAPPISWRGALAHIASDVLKYRLLGSKHQPELWREWLRKLGIAEWPTAQFIDFDSFHLLYEAAVNGLGIAMGLEVIVEPYLDDGRLSHLCDVRCALENILCRLSRA